MAQGKMVNRNQIYKIKLEVQGSPIQKKSASKGIQDFNYILLLRSTASSMRSPRDCSIVAKSETLEERILFPSMPLKHVLSELSTIPAIQKQKQGKQQRCKF